jgi:uncharacterized protein YbaP (TraB family)
MRRRPSRSLSAVLLCWWALCAPAHAESALHSLWEVHGKHNTVYLLGSVHVLRPGDYPLAPAVLAAYAQAKSLLMEIDPNEMESPQVQAEMLQSALLPEGPTLKDILGGSRYQRAAALAHELGVDLTTFEQFAPWFVAEAISQQQLTNLGFEPQSGVEMYFMQRAQSDGKPVAGLETAHDQIALFHGMALDTQAQYLMDSLAQAHDMPKQVNDMVRAWQHGDTAWFEADLKDEFGSDPALYRSLLSARNRNWLPRIEALLDDDKNYLVIVGTAHLIGTDGVVALLKKDGIGATQR